MGAPLRLAPIKGQEPLLSSISEGVQPWNGGGAQIIFLFLPQPLAAAILWGGGHRGQKYFIQDESMLSTLSFDRKWKTFCSVKNDLANFL